MINKFIELYLYKYQSLRKYTKLIWVRKHGQSTWVPFTEQEYVDCGAEDFCKCFVVEDWRNKK